MDPINRFILCDTRSSYLHRMCIMVIRVLNEWIIWYKRRIRAQICACTHLIETNKRFHWTQESPGYWLAPYICILCGILVVFRTSFSILLNHWLIKLKWNSPIHSCLAAMAIAINNWLEHTNKYFDWPSKIMAQMFHSHQLDLFCFRTINWLINGP